MSESIFDKPLNGDLEALSSSVVKSINGKKPDPITGDITVIEGGGSGSYGAYRLDTTIPVSSWSGSGPYTVTIVNELIKSTMDGKSWLDNDTALLEETTFTSQDGSLLISTPVKPTEDWVLHVSFALNGADVLADSEEQKKAIGKIIPVITGTTNNSGYTINSGDYFEANGNLYKASATIPTNESWSSSSDALTTSALSDIHAKIGDVGSTSLQSQVNTLSSESMTFRSRNIISVYTDAWLLTAKSGLYMVVGGDASGSFLEGVANAYGVLEVCIASPDGATGDEYGIVRFGNATNNEYYRSFYRKKSSNTITWRGNLETVTSINKHIDFQFIPDNSISAGTIGTRATQLNKSLDIPSGYNIASIVITYIGNSSKIIPSAFAIGNMLYLNLYYASASEITTAEATVNLRVTYTKLN